MHLILVRHAYLPELTLGTLLVDGAVLHSLERPWIPDPDGPGGQALESCIPDGDYSVIAHDSAKHPGVYALENEQLGVYYRAAPPPGMRYGRTAILLHGADHVTDLLGCLGLGMSQVIRNNEIELDGSDLAMRHVRARLGRTESHTLSIRPTSGTTLLPT